MSTSSQGLWTINLFQIVELLKTFERHGIEFQHWRKVRSDNNFAFKVVDIIRQHLLANESVKSSLDMFPSMEFGQLGATLAALEKLGLELEDLQKIREEDIRVIAGQIQEQFDRFAKPVTMKQVVKLFDKDKIINGKKAAELWERDLPKGRIPINYTIRTIESCVNGNRIDSDWRLIYIFNWSLRELRKMLGNDPRNPPNFDNSEKADWWLKTGDRVFKQDINKKPQAGYYLINFKPEGINCDFCMQSRLMGDWAEHCDAAVFAQAIFTTFKLNGEKIFEKWVHWCDLALKPGNHVAMWLSDTGLAFTSNMIDFPQKTLGAAACWKWEFN